MWLSSEIGGILRYSDDFLLAFTGGFLKKIIAEVPELKTISLVENDTFCLIGFEVKNTGEHVEASMDDYVNIIEGVRILGV